MIREQLLEQFKQMFPQYADSIISYKKVGSKTLSINLQHHKSLVFLYEGPDNWTLGTKLYRMRPDQHSGKE
jgi:hypothetical protein